MLLTPAEVIELTRRTRPTAQGRVLQQMGIPYRTHPADGVLVVARAAVAAHLGCPGSAPANDGHDYEVNVDKILGGQDDGKAPSKR